MKNLTKSSTNARKQRKTFTRILGYYIFFAGNALFPLMAHAENEYARAAAAWILDGLFWVVIVGGLIAIAASAIKRNLTAVLISFLLTAAVAFIISDAANGATVIKSVGETVKSIFKF